MRDPNLGGHTLSDFVRHLSPNTIISKYSSGGTHEIDEANDELSFSDYNAFVKSMKVFPEKYAIIYPTLGMMGEAGEVSEKVKKWMRGDRELDKAELVKEVGDVLWYLTALADDLGYTLEDVAKANVAKLSDRRDRGVVKGSGDNR